MVFFVPSVMSGQPRCSDQYAPFYRANASDAQVTVNQYYWDYRNNVDWEFIGHVDGARDQNAFEVKWMAFFCWSIDQQIFQKKVKKRKQAHFIPNWTEGSG